MFWLIRRSVSEGVSSVQRTGFGNSRPGFKLTVESDQSNPLRMVFTLPVQRPMQAQGNRLRGQVVMQAEVLLVEGFALRSQAQQQ